MKTKEKFDVYDYLVFAAVLAFTMFIGLYHGLKKNLLKWLGKEKVVQESGGNEKVSEYLTASSSMNPIPVAFSLLASFFSATALLGMPAEVYTYGFQYYIIVFGQIVTPILGAYFTGPLFARLKLLSVFEYLKIRFNSEAVRLVGTVCYLVRTFISTAIFMYGPATSLSIFTNMNDNVAISIIGIVGTIYTTIGGIKAVIWTDFFQMIIMFTGLFTIIGKGIHDVGGMSNLLEITRKGGRLELFDINPDPFVRQTTWSLFFGMVVYFSMSYCIDQQMVQRFAATKSVRSAQIALLLNVPGILFLVSCCCFCGLVIFANYYGCDPLKEPGSKLTNPNQLLSFMVLDKLSIIPGLAGLFLSSLFSASLSSVSSCLNSMSALIFQDFLKRFKYFQSFDDKKNLNLTRFLSFICGIISLALTFMIASVGGNLTQISSSLNGAFNAPILGLFVLGCFFKISNAPGAIAGAVAGFASGLWISFGSYLAKPSYPKLDVTIEFCNQTFSDYNITVLDSFKPYQSSRATNLSGFNTFYSLSYMLYTVFGLLVTVIVGLIVSVITKGYREDVDESLLLIDLSRPLTFITSKKKSKVDPIKTTGETQSNRAFFMENGDTVSSL